MPILHSTGSQVSVGASIPGPSGSTRLGRVTTDAALDLPVGFVLGTCSSAPQSEGAGSADGRGPSIWDTFAAQPGRILDGSRPTPGTDGYHRVEEDLALLRGLGPSGHRFSVSWSRVVPTGSGAVNQAGLDHYDRLVDGLLAAGQDPMATLYQWDLPQPLEEDGGWLNPATVERFAEYAAVVGQRLADRVTHWVPLHQPTLHMLGGYATGAQAPGKTLHFDALWAQHHLLVGHGRAVVELRRAGATSVGCANLHAPIWPASESEEDLGASKFFDAIHNGCAIEPMLLGRYPADVAPLMEHIVQPGDMATIRQPLDFYGVDHHHPLRVAATPPDQALPFAFRVVVGHPVTGAGRPIVPEALREWLITFRARFRAALPPIVVTGIGASFHDDVTAQGTIDDQDRIAHLRAHLGAVADAIRRGVDVRGFYVDSLVDEWAWTDGFTQRFGLVHVDVATQQRTPKSSYDWYRRLIAAHGPTAPD